MIAPTISKVDWILLALRAVPLDRIRLMKTLFLVWQESERDIPDYFGFEPYLYGPCSFEVYDALRELRWQRLVVQPPYPIQKWAPYYLTELGQRRVEQVAKEADPEAVRLVERLAREAHDAEFLQLLKKVYSLAPDFAVNSVVRTAV